jgi:O-antigen/teichoic acid export membrane protein
MLHKISQIVSNTFHKDLGYITFAKIISLIIGFALNAFIVRVLTKEDFGVISTLSILVYYFAMLADYATASITQRDITKNDNNYHQLYSIYVNAKILTTIASIFVFFITITLLGYYKYRMIIVIIATNVFISSMANMPEILLHSFSKFKIYSKIMVILSILSSLIQAVIIYNHKTIKSFFVASLIISAVTLIVRYFIVGRVFPIIYTFYKAKLQDILELLKEATPLLLGAFFYLLYYRIDTIMVEKMLGLKAAAEFNLGFSVADQLLEIFWVQFIIVYYPRMIKLYKEEKEVLLTRLRRVTVRFLFVFILIFLIALLFSKPIFSTIFGSSYIGSAQIFTLLIPSTFLTIVFGLYYRVLVLSQRQAIYLYLMVMGAVLNLVLDYAFIRMFSTVGVVYATFIVNLVISASVLAYASNRMCPVGEIS